MKAIPLLIVLSLLANAALAFKWWQSRPTKPAPAAATPAVQPAAKPGASKLRDSVPAPSVNATPARPTASAKPTWAQFFSDDDLKGSIQRLRAVGCPEETIQDLMVAAVTRRFADRRKAALAGMSSSNEAEYWKATDYNSPEARERQKKYRELDREASALLVELLGFDPQKKLREESGGGYYERQVSFVAPEKREQLRRYLEEFQERENEHYSRNRGMYDAQERAERKELQEEKKRGLAAFLTPEEVRQWELRSSQMASQLQSEITTMSLTQAQYEALFAIRSKVGDAIFNWSDQADDPKSGERAKQAGLQLRADIKATLGEDLAKEWELATNYDYKQLFSMAKAENLPADTAKKVYGYKEQAEAKAKEVRAMTELSREQQQQTLTALRTETENAMKATLGDTLYNRYKSRAYWLNSISYTPSVRTSTIVPK